MPRNPWILNSGPEAFFHKNVAVTDATSLHLNSHLPWARIWDLTLNDFEIAAWLRDLCNSHWCYCNLRRCHKSSFVLCCEKTLFTEHTLNFGLHFEDQFWSNWVAERQASDASHQPRAVPRNRQS